MPTLFIQGLIAHLFADWFLQNDWQANHKTSLKHPAAYVHSGLHFIALLLVFPWAWALAIAISHLLIDTRKPLVWWRTLIGQKQVRRMQDPNYVDHDDFYWNSAALAVAFWQDQVVHVVIIFLAATSLAS